MSRRSGSARGWTARLLSATAIFAAGAAIIGTLVPFGGEWYWRADLFTHFRAQYVIMLGLATPFLLVFRRWVLAALAIAALGFNLWVIIKHRGRAVELAESGGKPAVLRVATFNVLQGNEELGRAEKFLREVKADVVVFQEVTPEWARTLTALKEVYPHQVSRLTTDSKGAALIARVPGKDLRFEPMPGQKQIGTVTGLFPFAGRFTRVMGIHSHKPTSADGAVSQRDYFHWLAQRASAAQAEGRDVVVLGDFNATPWSKNLHMLAVESGLRETSGEIVFGATWSYLLPHRLLIDHAFVSPNFRLVSRAIGPALGSDHRPLILELALKR